MTAAEFSQWVVQFGGVYNIPKHPFKQKWAEIYNEIAPHYYGNVPKILEKTFPNEDERIAEYRQEVYQAKTESCVTEFTNKLSRLMQDSKYSVVYQSEPMKQFMGGLMVEGEFFTDYFLSKFPSKRMLDPNGVFLAYPTGQGVENSNVAVDISFKFIESKYIDFIDLDEKVLIYRAPKYANKYKSVSALNTNQAVQYISYVVTDEFYGYIEVDAQGDAETKYLVVTYEHNLGALPFVVLGGRPLSEDYNGFQFSYFKSDISSAIPFLNGAAISDNQEFSTTMANAFPVKILQGVECVKCNGQGEYLTEPTPGNPDRKIQTCGTCGGTGQNVSLSPMGGIYIKKEPKYNDANNSADLTPIEWVSPNTSILDYLSNYTEKKYEQAKEILNIEKAVKYAQSAVAKEVDKEPEYIEIKRISDSVFARLNYMIYIVQGLRFMDNDNSIVVIPPTSFDIKNEAELFEEYKQTIAAKAPDFVRASAFKDWLKQRFSTDKAGQKIAEICLGYAKMFLYTIEEQKEYYLMGVVGREDMIKASSVFNLVVNAYQLNPEFIEQDIETIYAQLDAALANQFALANLGPAEEDDFSDL